jgi:hypothetical protein
MPVSIGKFCSAFFRINADEWSLSIRICKLTWLANSDERQESGVQGPYGVPEFHTLSFKT